MNNIAWHTLTKEEVFKNIDSGSHGLDEQTAKKRLEKFGKNELPHGKRASALKIFLRQFQSVLIIILLVAVGITLFLKDYVDAYVILGAVVLNVIISFVQEYRAQNAIQALRSYITEKAIVIRDNKQHKIPVEEIVPGDILVLNPGDKVAADARLLKTHNLRVSEAVLTGEPFPVTKTNETLAEKDLPLGDRKNLVFSGTLVSEGSGLAVVYGTGSATELGSIAKQIIETEDEKTPLQHKLARFGLWLGLLVIVISAVVFFVGILLGNDPLEMFITGIALAVSAVPEGLPLALTVILAIGTRRILKRKALVRKLIAAETLGSVSVIATDKTGTITKAVMEVSEIVPAEISSGMGLKLPGGEFSEAVFGEKGSLLANILETAWLASDAQIENTGAALHKLKIIGSPTEVAIVRAANQAGLNYEKLSKQYTRKDVVPFTSARKFMAVLLSEKGGVDHNLVFLKGASEKLISAATFYEDQDGVQKMSDKARESFLKNVDRLSAQGLRVLAVAKSKVAKDVQELPDEESELLHDLVYLGLIVIKDPLRPNVSRTLKQIAAAGVKTILITGDHAETARAIAKEIGLPSKRKNVITGAELKELDEQEFRKRLRDLRIYARVTPEDKLRIIDAWQAEGEVIAMTGDGVNDAPAVQGADIGIAVGSGSDVVKETADLILLDDNFKTIVAAVEEGRTIFDNFRKVTRYLISDSFTEIIVILFGFIMGWPLPLIATQILWVNIVNDGAPDVALAFDPRDPEIMNEPPRSRKEAILGKADLWLVGLISVITATGILLVFWLATRMTGDLAYARTMAFTLLGIDSLFYIFSIRSLRHSIFREHIFSNKWLLGAVVLGFGLQAIALYVPFFQKILETVPLGVVDWLIVLGSVAVTILLIELFKYVLMARRKKRS